MPSVICGNTYRCLTIGKRRDGIVGHSQTISIITEMRRITKSPSRSVSVPDGIKASMATLNPMSHSQQAWASISMKRSIHRIYSPHPHRTSPMIRALALNVAVAVAAVAIFGLVMSTVPARAAQCGKASFYAGAHHGKRTASGEVFNMHALTAAMPSRKYLGQRYRVTAGSKSVEVRINDVGPASWTGRIIDLSAGAFAKLAHPDKGIISVCLERVR